MKKPSRPNRTKGAKGSISARTRRVLLVTLLALLAIFALAVRFAYEPEAVGAKVELSQITALAESELVRHATLLDEDAVVVVRRCAGEIVNAPPAGTTTATTAPPVATPPPGDPAAAPPVAQPPAPADEAPAPCEGPTTTVHASYPRSDVSTQLLIQALSDSGAAVAVDTQTTKAMAKLVVTFVLPLVVLANLFGLIFLSRGGDTSMAEVAGFGRIGRARQRKRRSGTGVTFADVAGAEEAVTELAEVTAYLGDPARFEAYGATPPKGVLLFGAPGCGKTLLAKAVAGESDVPFFSISGAEFVESLVGVGAARVRDLFAQVRAVAPAIVFIDEIDAVGRRRSGEGSSGGEREQTVNQLLVEMDGFEASLGIVVIAATNRPDMLDPALLRPGRFDRHITVEAPDAAGRRAILALHARNRPIGPDVDFDDLARRTPGFTGADLANVVNEAALLSLRTGPDTLIGATQMTEAVLRVLHGPQRRGRILSGEERARLAYHEAGHAIVAAGLGRRHEVSRLSIVARGKGLARSVMDQEERDVLSATDLSATLAMALAGVAAEEAVFGESSTTGSDDLARASATAKDMVGTYGMSDQIGRRRLLASDDTYGADGAGLEAVSGAVLQAFDVEVKALLDAAEDAAMALLVGHRDELDSLAQALQEQETIDGPALTAHLAGVGPLSHNSPAAANGRPRRKAPR